VALAIAPLLGGWIVDHFSWRWIFLVNPLIALPTIWIAYYHVPESRDPEAKPRLDWRGALLVLLGLGGLAYGLIASPVSGSDRRIVAAHRVFIHRVGMPRADVVAVAISIAYIQRRQF
jgi:MFS family permease